MKTYNIKELSKTAQGRAIDSYCHRAGVYDESNETIICFLQGWGYEFNKNGKIIN